MNYENLTLGEHGGLHSQSIKSRLDSTCSWSLNKGKSSLVSDKRHQNQKPNNKISKP